MIVDEVFLGIRHLIHYGLMLGCIPGIRHLIHYGIVARPVIGLPVEFCFELGMDCDRIGHTRRLGFDLGKQLAA